MCVCICTYIYTYIYMFMYTQTIKYWYIKYIKILFMCTSVHIEIYIICIYYSTVPEANSWMQLRKNPLNSCQPCLHRRRQGSVGGRWEPVSDLHGRNHRLCAAGVRPHGHLHQMWQEDERVPHLQAVRGAGCARLQVLNVDWRTRQNFKRALVSEDSGRNCHKVAAAVSKQTSRTRLDPSHSSSLY